MLVPSLDGKNLKSEVYRSALCPSRSSFQKSSCDIFERSILYISLGVTKLVKEKYVTSSSIPPPNPPMVPFLSVSNLVLYSPLRSKK